MSMEDNKAIIRRFYDEVINRRHLAVLDEMLAPTFEGFKAEGADHASNCEDFKHILAFALRTFPECQQTIHDWHIEKDVVVTRWSLCGKIMEHWVELDTLHLGRQIAAIAPLDDEREE